MNRASELFTRRLRNGLQEIKWRMQPVELVLLEPTDPKAEIVITIAQQFPIQYEMPYGDARSLRDPVVSELRGAAHRLFVIGERRHLADAKFQRSFYTTEEEPWNDNHAFLRFASNLFIQDAHFLKQQLVDVELQHMKNRVKFPITTDFSFDEEESRMHDPMQIMFYRWIGRLKQDGPAYAGVSVK